MTYITIETKEMGPGRARKEVKVDVASFSKDLAKALGATVAKIDEHMRDGHCEIDLGDNTQLDVYANNWKATVNVSIQATDVKHGERSTYDKAQRTESATVNPDGRKIETIAKDIKRRVIDANAPALAAQRAYRDQRRNGREQIALLAGRLKELLPVLDVRKRNDEDEHVTIYCGSPYVSAVLSADGKVRVERIESMDMGTFVRVFETLAKAQAPCTCDANEDSMLTCERHS